MSRLGSASSHAYLVYGPPLSSSSKTSTFIDDLNGVDLPLHLRIVGGRTMPTSTITPLNFHYQPSCPASSSPRPSNLVFLLFFIAFFGINCYISKISLQKLYICILTFDCREYGVLLSLHNLHYLF